MIRYLLFLFPLIVYAESITAIYAVNTKTGEVLVDEYSQFRLIPASTLKLITTGCSLSLLDPQEKFTTLLEYDGSIEDGILKGNVYIRGGGDPTLGSASWQHQIDEWKLAIQQLGINTIEGSIIADDTAWEKTRTSPTWLVEDVGNYFGTGASALSFHENMYSIFFSTGEEVGASSQILYVDPPIPNLQIDNQVVFGSKGSGDRASVFGQEGVFFQKISGTIPVETPLFSIKGAMPDPGSTIVSLLELCLKDQVSVLHKEIPISKRTSFHQTESPTIEEIVKYTLKTSSNLHAEHLLKKIGKSITNQGSFQGGIQAIQDFFKKNNLTIPLIVDGSGLSRLNQLSAKEVVSFLTFMKQTQNFPLFLSSLPQGELGEFAKSGSMSFVKAYAGYLGNIAFAILINQHKSARVPNQEITNHLKRIQLLDSKTCLGS